MKHPRESRHTHTVPKTRIRCDAVVVQLLMTEYDEHDRPIREQIAQPVKVFRAGAADFWAEADKAITAMRGDQ
jgi:hypothetical protein